eukprot:12887252-Prorocentrum_lima.AAC.1
MFWPRPLRPEVLAEGPSAGLVLLVGLFQQLGHLEVPCMTGHMSTLCLLVPMPNLHPAAWNCVVLK